MKKMQSYRIDTDTIKQIDRIGEIERRTKSNVIEIAIEKYYQKLKGENEMNKTYKIWAINNQGASVDVAKGDIFTSIRKAEEAARAEMGSGWKINITESDNGYIVKTFTIR